MRFASVIAERRFLILFVAILLDWVVYPLLESASMAKVLLGSFTLAILLSALLSVISGPGLRGLALALGTCHRHHRARNALGCAGRDPGG